MIKNGSNLNMVKKDNVKYSLSVPAEAIELQARVASVYGNANSIVTIISDDGRYNSCVNINRIFGDRKLRCTVAGVISLVEPHREDWNKLLENGTIELVSHSFNHIRMEDGSEISRDVDALTHEIVDAKKWYEDWLGYEQIVFVCPENQMCEIGYRILGNNDFWSVRKGRRGYNPLSPEDGMEEGQWFNLMVQGICDKGVDLNIRNSWVDKAIIDGTWLIEMWHNVMLEQDGGYQTILISDAEEHLDYIMEKADRNQIWVATYTEAVKYIREKQNLETVAYIKDNELHIITRLTDDSMSYETFNQPLTLLFDLPEGFTITNDNDVSLINGGNVKLNIIPGRESIFKLIGE